MNFNGLPIQEIPKDGSRYISVKVYAVDPSTLNIQAQEKAIIPTGLNDKGNVFNLQGFGPVLVVSAPATKKHVWADVSKLALVPYEGEGSVRKYLESKGNPSKLDVRYDISKPTAPLNVTTLQNMFGNCTSLTEIDVSYLDLSQTDYTLSEMFYNCQNLKYVNFGNVDTSKVTSFQSMFKGCVQLQEVDGVLDFASVEYSEADETPEGRYLPGHRHFPSFKDCSSKLEGLQFKNVPREMNIKDALGLEPSQYTVLSYR